MIRYPYLPGYLYCCVLLFFVVVVFFLFFFVVLFRIEEVNIGNIASEKQWVEYFQFSRLTEKTRSIFFRGYT